MAIRKELIDELPATSEGPLTGPNGLSRELTKALAERMLGSELTHHLGHEKHDVAGYGSGNSRNGFAWFKDVLGRIAEHPITRIQELLPHRWAQASR